MTSQRTESLYKQEKTQVFLLQKFVTWTASPMPMVHGRLPEGAIVTVTRQRIRGHTAENASQ